MKNKTLKTLFGGTLVAGAMIIAPVSASALDADALTNSQVRFNRDGVVQVVNAEVTSVTGNLINAITRFKNNVVNWSFTTNASTSVNVKNATTPTTDVLVGDRINVAGTLSSLGSTLGLNATLIKSFYGATTSSTTTSSGAVAGKVTAINPTNGSFTMKTSNDRIVTVMTNASTTWKLHKATSTPTLANLATGAKVTVIGTANADGTVMTASQIVAKLDEEKNKKSNKGTDKGLKNGWKEKSDRDNSGKHYGFLKSIFKFEDR